MSAHRLCLAAAAALVCMPVLAVNKCTLPSGAVVYQDAMCDNTAATAQAVRVAPGNVMGQAANRPDHIRAAIGAKRPAVGMTLAELHRAIGLPDKVNTGDYGSRQHDQLIYYTESRTLYVYVTNGVVSAIQNTDGGQPGHPGRTAQADTAPIISLSGNARCPSAMAVRNIEVEMSKLEHRGRERVQADLRRQLDDARACRN